jgi:hypothetical protein
MAPSVAAFGLGVPGQVEYFNLAPPNGLAPKHFMHWHGLAVMAQCFEQASPHQHQNLKLAQETGGLVYLGKAIPGGQDADVSLTFDQYNQDQVVYLHHEEHKGAHGLKIDDGLTIIERPDWKGVKEEYSIYKEMDKLNPEEREALKLKSVQAGKISTRRAFFGVRRGT